MLYLNKILFFILVFSQATHSQFDAKLDFHATHQLETSLDDGGDFNLTRYGVELRLGRQVTDNDSIKFKFQYQRDVWDFDGFTVLPELVDHNVTIDTVDFAFSWFHAYDQDTTYFVSALSRSSTDGDFFDGFVGGGSAGYIHRYSPNLTFGLGAGFIGQPHDDPRVFPVIVLDWSMSDTLRLTSDISSRFGSQMGLELVWEPSNDWTLGAGIAADYGRFRLDLQAEATEGAAEVSSMPISFRATRHFSPGFDFTLYGGIVMDGQIELIDGTRNELASDNYDPAGVFGILGKIQF